MRKLSSRPGHPQAHLIAQDRSSAINAVHQSGPSTSASAHPLRAASLATAATFATTPRVDGPQLDDASMHTVWGGAWRGEEDPRRGLPTGVAGRTQLGVPTSPPPEAAGLGILACVVGSGPPVPLRLRLLFLSVPLSLSLVLFAPPPRRAAVAARAVDEGLRRVAEVLVAAAPVRRERALARHPLQGVRLRQRGGHTTVSSQGEDGVSSPRGSGEGYHHLRREVVEAAARLDVRVEVRLVDAAAARLPPAVDRRRAALVVVVARLRQGHVTARSAARSAARSTAPGTAITGRVF